MYGEGREQYKGYTIRAWACSDVYGWIVTNDDGEELDSCWGYYGADHEESGLMDAARDYINEHIEKASKARPGQGSGCITR